MKSLYFKYTMEIRYSIVVSRCNYTIKCVPRDTLRQRIGKLTIRLFPESKYCWGEDGLRNAQIYGVNDTPHEEFRFHIEGEATTGLCGYEEDEDPALSMIFAHPHGLNVAGETIRAFHRELREGGAAAPRSLGAGEGSLPGDASASRSLRAGEGSLPGDVPASRFLGAGEGSLPSGVSASRSLRAGEGPLPGGAPSPYETAVAYMHALHERFAYQSGTTGVDTMAEEAFAQGHGVCQDYAHILISLLHLSGIPARYVTGFIIGEGQSHGWVEVLSGGRWYGIDPTNDQTVGEDYIRIGVGRDDRDCRINRGIMHGGGQHTQDVQVSVEEIGTDAAPPKEPGRG